MFIKNKIKYSPHRLVFIDLGSWLNYTNKKQSYSKKKKKKRMCDRNHLWPTKPKYILSGLYQKKFLDPCPRSKSEHKPISISNSMLMFMP